MTAINLDEFESNLDAFFDKIEDDNETFFIEKKGDKSLVLMPLDEYNAINEMLHLLGSKSNVQRLYESVDQLKDGRKVYPNLDT